MARIDLNKIVAMLAAYNLKQSGVSSAEIARQVGVSRSTINRWISIVRGV